VNTYLRIFGIVFSIAAVYGIGRALVTGAVHIKGMREPIRRQDRPRDYWFALGLCTFIFAILIWAFITV
jgi:hypothetical protein